MINMIIVMCNRNMINMIIYPHSEQTYSIGLNPRTTKGFTYDLTLEVLILFIYYAIRYNNKHYLKSIRYECIKFYNMIMYYFQISLELCLYSVK